MLIVAMVTLAANHGVNTLAVDLDVSQLASIFTESFTLNSGQTATGFTIDNGSVSFVVTGEGFTYSAGPLNTVPTGGTIETFTNVTDGADTHYRVSGLNLDLATIVAHGGLLDTLFKGATIIGSPEPDYLDGSAGHDKINGGAGSDKIVGGAGDVLTGGLGHDKFIFGTHFGKDIITDFSAGDVMAIAHTIFHNFAAVKSHADLDSHHHVVITEGSNSITLDTVHHVSNLKAGEFLFT